MKYFGLYETGANTGLYALGSIEFEADSTSDAVAQAEKSAPPGCRTGVWPYQMISGTPSVVTPTDAENGKQYHVLAQPGGAAGQFAGNGQIFASIGADAAGMCLSLQKFFGYRLGLIATDAKPAPVASGSASTSASASVASSGTASGGSTSSSGGSVASGGTAAPAA
ncbi:hypothetical protein LHT11_08760 [Acetobacter indonesiensis]|uniref:hypothetical protein n=1 Tax=Acetobacter indonesiensis TaxID=104101 RepID=UPI001F2B28E0|nr:hypothetical protein [Acetobacter indonesiensis]MCG0995290.1 hypothetical protein [Acetobacter indonesiensis]